MKYKLSQYAKKYNVGYRTVWNWVKQGKVKVERTDTNRLVILENEDKQMNDAVAILVELGIKKEDATKLVKAKATETDKADQIIRKCL